MVMRLPERDRLSVTKEKLEADLAVAMGGRVAEELIFGAEKVTSGASSDIKYATSMARNMVAAWGMSDKIGPLFHGNDNDEVFLGHQIMHQKQGSEETANLIDAEVKRFVEAGYNRATKILKDNAAELETLAKGLLEYETLTGDEIKDLLAGKKIDRKSINDASDDSGTPAVSTIPKTGKPKKDGSSGDADTKPIQA